MSSANQSHGRAEPPAELVREIMKYAPDESLARHLAALMGDRPIMNEYRRVFVMDGEKVLARLPMLQFFDDPDVFWMIDGVPNLHANVQLARAIQKHLGLDERTAVKYATRITSRGPVFDLAGRMLVVDAEGKLLTRLDLPHSLFAELLQPPPPPRSRNKITPAKKQG